MDQDQSSFPGDAGNMPVACVIVAGGSGTRCGGTLPKQYCDLVGGPVLSHTVRFFDNQRAVDMLVIVVAPDMMDLARRIVGEIVTQKPVRLVAGGLRRQDSVLAGVRGVERQGARVIIHDGARPFPPENLEEGLALLERLSGEGEAPCGVVFGMPATDSIKRVGEGERVRETVSRHDLWTVQTPQIFHAEALIEALEYCDEVGAEVTDDASAFEHKGWPVYLIMGTRTNIKITYAEDFMVAEAILRSRSNNDVRLRSER